MEKYFRMLAFDFLAIVFWTKRRKSLGIRGLDKHSFLWNYETKKFFPKVNSKQKVVTDG